MQAPSPSTNVQGPENHAPPAPSKHDQWIAMSAYALGFPSLSTVTGLQTAIPTQSISIGTRSWLFKLTKPADSLSCTCSGLLIVGWNPVCSTLAGASVVWTSVGWTSLDWTVPGWAGAGWTPAGWTGVGWITTGWTGVGWISVGWAGANGPSPAWAASYPGFPAWRAICRSIC